METHFLFTLAKRHWLDAPDVTYDAALVQRLYFEHISASDAAHSLLILEFSQYLEK